MIAIMVLMVVVAVVVACRQWMFNSGWDVWLAVADVTALGLATWLCFLLRSRIQRASEEQTMEQIADPTANEDLDGSAQPSSAFALKAFYAIFLICIFLYMMHNLSGYRAEPSAAMPTVEHTEHVVHFR